MSGRSIDEAQCGVGSGNWDMHVPKSNLHFQFEFLLLNTTAHCSMLEFWQTYRKTMEFNYDSIEM